MLCQYCEQRTTKGGHRFCRCCLGEILSMPTPEQRPAWMKKTYTYPPSKRTVSYTHLWSELDSACFFSIGGQRV